MLTIFLSLQEMFDLPVLADDPKQRGKEREVSSEERDLPVTPGHQPLFSSPLLEKRKRVREAGKETWDYHFPLFISASIFKSYYQPIATKASKFFLSPWLNSLIPKGFYKPKQSAGYPPGQHPLAPNPLHTNTHIQKKNHFTQKQPNKAAQPEGAHEVKTETVHELCLSI